MANVAGGILAFLRCTYTRALELAAAGPISKSSLGSPTVSMSLDPAIYTLSIVVSDGINALLLRLRMRLEAEQAPSIAIDHRPAALRFVCDTWRPTLVSRVNDAIDAEIGPAERERRFRAFR